MGRTLVMTDSTASLPAQTAEQSGLAVINLHVIVDGIAREENAEISVQSCSQLVSQGVQLTTSQPNREQFERAFARAASDGFEHVVVVTLSSRLSGTYATATTAALNTPVQVTVIDSRTAGMALGLSALAGARLAQAGASPRDVVAEIRGRLERSGALFMVDSLDHLRRGGRLSPTAAAIGGALGMKPVLQMTDSGELGVVSRARTKRSAFNFMVERAVAAVEAAEYGVHYFGLESSAHDLADAVVTGSGKDVFVSEASAVLGAHVGPGMVAVTWA